MSFSCLGSVLDDRAESAIAISFGELLVAATPSNECFE